MGEWELEYVLEKSASLCGRVSKGNVVHTERLVHHSKQLCLRRANITTEAQIKTPRTYDAMCQEPETNEWICLGNDLDTSSVSDQYWRIVYSVIACWNKAIVLQFVTIDWIFGDVSIDIRYFYKRYR